MINLIYQTEILDSMKMLGFPFGRRPNAEMRVYEMKKKFHAKLWIIRNLASINTSKSELVAIYATFIRIVIEYVSVVYHCLLSKEMDQAIEDMQKTVLKLIYRWRISH